MTPPVTTLPAPARGRAGGLSTGAVPQWVSYTGGAVLLAVVVWRLGTGPFMAGLRSLDVGVLLAAAAIGALTTACCAWRWSAVAGGLGVGLSFPGAVAAYYRSLFLNSVLPGGILGDVHRGVAHGREAADVGLGLRAVGWERASGQVVQIALTVGVLLAAPSPVRGAMPWVLLAIAAVAVGGLALRRRRSGRGSTPSENPGVLGIAARDIRLGVLDRRVLPVVVITSTIVVVGQTATFVLAARTAGSTAAVGALAPVALLVFAAMTVPTSIGGWGPREGAAAWVFAAAGWGAAQGVATATVYGVMSMVVALPGAVVLLLRSRRVRVLRAGRVAHV